MTKASLSLLELIFPRHVIEYLAHIKPQLPEPPPPPPPPSSPPLFLQRPPPAAATAILMDPSPTNPSSAHNDRDLPSCSSPRNSTHVILSAPSAKAHSMHSLPFESEQPASSTTSKHVLLSRRISLTAGGIGSGGSVGLPGSPRLSHSGMSGTVEVATSIPSPFAATCRSTSNNPGAAGVDLRHLATKHEQVSQCQVYEPHARCMSLMPGADVLVMLWAGFHALVKCMEWVIWHTSLIP